MHGRSGVCRTTADGSKAQALHLALLRGNPNGLGETYTRPAQHLQ